MKHRRQRKRLPWVQAAFMACWALIGGICGWSLVFVMEEVTLWETALLLAGMGCAIYLQLIAHEAGHLIFGLLTGYRFASFRIGSLVWIARGGKVQRCRYSLAGTGGQCLMKPPELTERMPVALYNLGGSIVNALLGAACALGATAASGAPRALCVVGAATGLGFALMNGVPLRGAVANDGANARELQRDPAARRAFWIQLKVNELQGDGLRLRDMPGEWFVMPGAAELKDGLIAELAALCCERLMDERRFDEAAAALDGLLGAESALAELNRMLLVCDRAYCALLHGEPGEGVAAMLDDRLQRKLMKAMRRYPAVLRTQFARALLLERDVARAEEIAGRFDAVARRYPYSGEIEGERERMAIAREMGAA